MKFSSQEVEGNYFMFFVPYIVIQLCNVNQQNARFQIKCSNSILGVF